MAEMDSRSAGQTMLKTEEQAAGKEEDHRRFLDVVKDEKVFG